ncbi:uncharacterized protein LOC125020298 [Mugil cephalus]|uniref:uncharacterized protein LOC125020298 n=1 Tax=Mugil cephalus TaxID=48193 RepID=UPI001FB690AE|nr:uncharacterized protein LOC125020298 [Mugil cephalus]
MIKLVLLLLLCHVSSSVKHSLMFYVTASSGVPNLPEFMVLGQVDDIQVIYSDGSKKIFEPRQDWTKKLFDDNPQLWTQGTKDCFEIQPPRFKSKLNSLIQLFNHSEGSGVHILQLKIGCEWNETTGEVAGFERFGYDGEDFIELDLKRLTLTALRPEANIIKQKWDKDTNRIKYDEQLLTQTCPEWLKLSLKYGNSSLLRTDVPSVSLLQKTPSSPVSCHATGFYPDRAMMFWRKDGEEIHEGVEHGEILPNHDGSFQMNVDLNISSVSPEDWRRYDCVFHLSGVEDDIITKLDETQIRTNWAEMPRDKTITTIIIISAVVVVVVVVFAAAAGYMVYKKKQDQKAPPDLTDSENNIDCGSSGLPNLSEVQDWMRKIFENDTRQMDWYTKQCTEKRSNFFKAMMYTLKQLFNQSVHILQLIEGCEWDETSGNVTASMRFGYDGEDFIELHYKMLTWTALKPEADFTNQRWNNDRIRTKQNEKFLTQDFNLSLAQAVILTCLKSASIIPLPEEVTHNLNDFHPVALTPVIIKCFERLVVQHIKDCLPLTLDPLPVLRKNNLDRKLLLAFYYSSIESLLKHFGLKSLQKQNKMKTLLLLLLFCRVSSTVKHSLKYFITGSSEVSELLEFEAVVSVDDIQAGYCGHSDKKLEFKMDRETKVFDTHPQKLFMYVQYCFMFYPDSFKDMIPILKQDFNQSEGVHILQLMHGCEWDEKTGEVTGFMQYGYDGEDLIELDLKALTWVALKPQAVSTKLKWDSDVESIQFNKEFLTQTCPEWLKMYLHYGKNSLLRTALPSVSLLQKTPSSPVSCHATGFYPDRAMMFWRKDGEEIHEGVEHGEILPNHDGSFQMNVDLNISSVSPEDWRRYDCVFHLSGVEDDIITKLDETQIRTNWVEKPRNKTSTIIISAVVVVVVVVVVAAAAGFMVHRKKQDQKAPPDSEVSSELSERLNPN